MSAGARRHPEAAPGLLLQLLETRALWEHYAAVATGPLWSAAARGDGGPVLVLPGLAAGDGSTGLLGRFLRSREFAAVGWGRVSISDCGQASWSTRTTCATSTRGTDAPSASSAGASAGFMRGTRRGIPGDGASVITLGSPFTGHPRETNAFALRFASGHRIGSHDFHGPLRAPPPVQTTSIWSPTDGVVSWRCCVESRRDLAENIVASRAIWGSGRIPRSSIDRRRLAQPEGGGSRSIAGDGGG